jgi:hypothetical protein
MRDCGEEFTAPDPAGYHQLTWGVILYLEGRESLCISWRQDSFGNPNRLAIVAGDEMSGDSLVVQDVSLLRPWSEFVGGQIVRFIPYSYRSNWTGSAPRLWHDVFWGLQLVFGQGSFLVAYSSQGEHGSQRKLNRDSSEAERSSV